MKAANVILLGCNNNENTGFEALYNNNENTGVEVL